VELLRLEKARWNALERVRLNIQDLNFNLHQARLMPQVSLGSRLSFLLL
jgi:hypothetical protein